MYQMGLCHRLSVFLVVLLSNLVFANTKPNIESESNQWLLAQQLLPEGFPGGKGPMLGSRKNISRGPATFQPNLGQMPSNIDFAAKSNGYRMYVTGSDLVFDLLSMDEGHPGVTPGLVTVSLVGANMMLAGHGEDKQPGVSNYLYGKDESKWVYDVPSYSKVRYSDVYPGIDLIFYGNGEREMEHDFIVSPGANYRDIKLAIQGAESIKISKQGHINIEAMGGGKLRLKKPLVYQLSGSGVKFEVPSHYELSADNQITFWIDERKYDRNLDLVIDPVTLSYSSYLGGSSDDVVLGMTSGNNHIYAVGYTKSSAFPTTSGAYQTGRNGSTDGFVSRVDQFGGPVNISTYFGGNGIDVVTSIKVIPKSGIGSGDEVFLTGYTASTDFPAAGTVANGETLLSTLPNGNHGGYDAFLVKMSSSLTLTGCTTGAACFSAYFGGTGFDVGMQIALDVTSIACTTLGSPCPMMIGTTSTSGIVVTNPALFPGYSGGPADAFIARFTTSFLATNQFTYYGTSGMDVGTAIAIDAAAPANVYIAGSTDTDSESMSTASGYQQNYGGGRRDVFIGKIGIALGDSSGKYGSYLGGTGDDIPSGIDVYPKTGSGNIYVVGTSTSTSGFDAVNGSSHHGGKDIFVANIVALDSSPQAVNYITFVGGSGDDDAPGIQSIVVDSSGLAWFVGRTKSADLATHETVNGYGFSDYPSGASLGMFGRLDSPSLGTNFSFVSYYGSNSNTAQDLLSAVTLIPAGYAILGGYLTESGAPLVGNSPNSYSGQQDGVIAETQFSYTGCAASNCTRGSAAFVNGNLFEIVQYAVTKTNAPGTSYWESANVPSTHTLVSAGGTSGSALLQMSPSSSTSQSCGGGSTYNCLTAAPAATTSFAQRYINQTGGTASVGAYAVSMSLNGKAPTCCSNGSDIEITVATGPAVATSLISATAILDSGYTLVGGGAWVSEQEDPASGNFIFASYPSRSAGATSASTYGYKLGTSNCLYSQGLSSTVHTGSGGTNNSTSGGSVSPVALSTANCDAWTVMARDYADADFSKITAYAIGVKSTILPKANVYVSAQVGATNTPTTAHATGSIVCEMGSGYTLTGGGAMAIWDTVQHFIHSSWPISRIGWALTQVASGADTNSQPIVYCIGIHR
jgi:hypothetical protein